MTPYSTLDDVDVTNKRVLLRLDLNLPLHEGKVTDLTRLERVLPTLRELVAHGARVIVLTHLGRPKGIDPALSLAPIAHALTQAMDPVPVAFCESIQGPTVLHAIERLEKGSILLLENIRFRSEEEANDPNFAREMATWGDLYVNDAFSAAHRAHASTEAITHLLPSYAGRLMEAELKALGSALDNPQRPLMAIVGGSKVSTKLPVLENLAQRVDHLVIGGAMANTFLSATGVDVGASLYEPGLCDTARKLLEAYPQMILPQDVVVAKDLQDPSTIAIRLTGDVGKDEKILDIGPLTCQAIKDTMAQCKTLLWNGPVGLYEIPPFDQGSIDLTQTAAALTQTGALLTVAGGGDTIALLARAGVLEDFTYVSTAGGAFLEWMEGKVLPGVEALGR